jgi:hypothetical protein
MRCRTSLSQAKGSTLLSFAVAMREQMVAHRTPARERVADGLGEGAGGWNAAKLHLEPRPHHLDERPGAGVTNMPTRVCGAALDRSLDRIEFGDPRAPVG